MTGSTRSPDFSCTLLLHPPMTTVAAQFASSAFSAAFGPRHHFHFSFLVGAGGAVIESAAGGFGYRMAHPNRRADSGDAHDSSHRSVFFHHAGSAVVCLGMVVRPGARDPPPGLRTERSGLVVRSAGRRDFRTAAFATAGARHRPAIGSSADAGGGGRFDDSSLRASAYCELALFAALVCGSGSLGRLGARQPPRWMRWFFPASMLLWVNLHGGWLVGTALLAIYTFAAFVESWRTQDALAAIRIAHRARAMALAWAASAVATLGNPFGWRLHAHIYRYLSDRYLMNRIEEFKSPDFHGWAQRSFAIILVLLLIAFAGSYRKLRLSHLLVALGALTRVLFVPQSSRFVDAAGAGSGAHPVGKLRCAGGQAGCLAVGAQWRRSNFTILRSHGRTGNRASGALMAGRLGVLRLRDLPSRRMAGFAASDRCAIRFQEDAGRSRTFPAERELSRRSQSPFSQPMPGEAISST